MLVFGHVGVSLGAVWAATAATRAIAPKPREDAPDTPRHLLRSPDFRLVIVGSMLPDIVDKPLWLLTRIGDGREPAHFLIFSLALTALGLALWWRRRWVGVWSLGVGSLLHTLEDEMWAHPQQYLWPLYGWAFREESTQGFTGAILDGLLHASRVYVPEVLGAIIVLVFAITIFRRKKVGSFARSGTIW